MMYSDIDLIIDHAEWTRIRRCQTVQQTDKKDEKGAVQENRSVRKDKEGVKQDKRKVRYDKIESDRTREVQVQDKKGVRQEKRRVRKDTREEVLDRTTDGIKGQERCKIGQKKCQKGLEKG